MARVYSVTPDGKGTYGIAYRAPALTTNGAHALTSIVRAGGGIVSNVGIENVGIDDAGAAAGPQPSSRSRRDRSCSSTTRRGRTRFFVDEIAGTAQIRGYVVMKDTTTNDGSFVVMQEQ
ncbi:MAG TPA: hypothetical protein VJZ76_19990 [Thermoanaerobaculia bacterium]|nr:hypothetical protein [Thermoanaerobaculia bacterium]